MSHITPNKRITTARLKQMKAKGDLITMLTAYDYTMAKILDDSGIEVLLVGDSAANVFAGHDTTLPITVDQMIYHASAVCRGASQALVLVDMPFGSYEENATDAFNAAVKIMKESRAHALKLEGGVEIVPQIKKITAAGIPICGHLGLTPQSVNQFGGFGVRAKDQGEAEKLISDAIALEEAGCFAIVVEKIPAELAKTVSQKVAIPIIGIGSGNGCDGQVLVVNDVLGLTKDFKPKFLRNYLNLYEEISGAVKNYISDVKTKDYPNKNEQY
ncbi:MAG TPA: 3-methyl-2-oxobutanoate hydroxymethyltransferase [Candidatus Sphingobacterium stercoripullorum]|uniref:3-methyl-2-oxobutanoate hydroxymethyltransferase n=1 Tax=Candidatus Sphingobacterium stercoripullorum TaxID=2838759 RepID=A0A9D1WA84_9SPHI|nr:3-methyl-2-oxobutanoate hydroxymethyltransferase [Candidatus Sphingobacterium stercoripullorum]